MTDTPDAYTSPFNPDHLRALADYIDANPTGFDLSDWDHCIRGKCTDLLGIISGTHARQWLTYGTPDPTPTQLDAVYDLFAPYLRVPYHTVTAEQAAQVLRLVANGMHPQRAWNSVATVEEHA